MPPPMIARSARSVMAERYSGSTLRRPPRGVVAVPVGSHRTPAHRPHRARGDPARLRVRPDRRTVPRRRRRDRRPHDRTRLGARDPDVRRRAAVRVRRGRATARLGAPRATARRVRALDQGRPARPDDRDAPARRRHRPTGARGPARRVLRRRRGPPDGLRLQRRRGAPVARGEPRSGSASTGSTSSSSTTRTTTGQAAIDGAYPALHRLREAGVVRAIGVGMNQSAMLARFATETEVDAFLLAGRYTLLDQDALGRAASACASRGDRRPRRRAS